MAFVPAKCVNCGGNLSVDDRRRAANCPYCNTPYVVEDAINYYHNVLQANDLHISLPNMEYIPPWKTRLDAAEAFLKLGEYDKALSIYVDLKEEVPQEYRVWWGQVRSITRDLTETIPDWDQLNVLYRLFYNATLFAPDKDMPLMKRQFMEYYSVQEQHIQKRFAERKLQQEQLLEEKLQLKMCLREWKQEKSLDVEQISCMVCLPLVLLLIAAFATLSEAALILAVMGFGIYGAAVFPALQKYINEQERKKEAAISEISERQKEIENELSQIESQLEHLRDPAEGQL